MTVYLDYKVIDSIVRRSVPGKGKYCHPPKRADRLWSSPRLVFKGYRECFDRTKAAGP